MSLQDEVQLVGTGNVGDSWKSTEVIKACGKINLSSSGIWQILRKRRVGLSSC